VAPTPRSSSAESNTGGNLAVTKPSGLASGDYMVAWHYADNDGSLSSMGAPSGWVLQGSHAGVSGGPPYVKVWTKVADSADASAISFTFTDSAASIFNSVAILAITTGTYDSTNPIAAAVTFQDGGTNSSASHIAPSVTGVADGLLCTSHGTDSGGSAATYTPPSGMTEQADTNSRSGSYTALEVNTLTLAAAGATGQKTATCSVSRPWQCSSLVIAPASVVGGGGGGSGDGAVGFRAASADDRGTANSCVPAPPAGTTAGDLLLAVQTSDYRGTLTEMAAPSGWTELANNSDRSSDVGFVKVWQKVATSSEPASYTFADSASATSDVVIVALTGYDSTQPLSVSPTWNSGGAQSTHVAPSINAASGDMFITAYVAGTNGTTRTYTGPSAMTLAKTATLSTSGYVLLGVYYEALTSTGATGSQIATCSAATPFVALSLAVEPPRDKTVSLSAIGSAAAFGSPTVTVAPAPQTVSPSGIASVEAFGSPVVTVSASDQTIVVVGVGSSEAFGTPVVAAGQNVLPGAIATAEAFGVPTVTMPQDLTGGAAAFGISNFGSAPFGGVIGTGPFPSATFYPGSTVYPGTAQSIPIGQTITPSSIPPTEAFGVPIVTVALGDQAMRITAIDSAEAFGIPTVTVSDPALVVQPGGILSAEAFGRAFVFVEVPPPVSTPGLDTYYVDGVDLRSFAWRITTADGLQNTPGVLGDDIVLPGLDGAVEVFGAFGQQRRPDSIGQITFDMWLQGVDPTTGLIPGGSRTELEYFARWDTLVRMFHRRRVTIDHIRPDATIRRAIAHLLPGQSITPSRERSSPWFGRFKATFAIPAAHWTDTSTITTGQQSLTTGSTLNLSAFSGATAPCTELTVTFGSGNNPLLSTSWGHIGWNGVIASGRQLSIDTATGTTGPGSGTPWTPGYDALTFAPGPRLFEIDPSEALSAILTHTGGGTMTVEVSGKRRYRTS
jgi:hypothetical protein